jgi:hypothetical protein
VHDITAIPAITANCHSCTCLQHGTGRQHQHGSY